MKRHRRKHYEPYGCDVCGNFIDAGFFENMQKKGEESFKCKDCSSIIFTEILLGSHW
jgi:DNA-directed RNA polymerase subunit RPC12/RpoP